MEDLTKQQMILLALLVSFVTSIATGIVTVSLMDQAPKGVTQTINRIVERTVEKVVPSSNNSAAVITKETVVVKSDDLVMSAVEKNKGKIIRIIKIREEYGTKKETFGGLAIPVSSKSNLLVADISILSKELDSFGSIIPESYKAVTSDGKSFQVVPVGVDETNNIVFFRAQIVDGKLETMPVLTPVTIGDSSGLKLGQTIIAIGGGDTNTISTGIIASFVSSKDNSYSLIKTDLRFSDAVSGTILLNLSGEVVGILAGKYSNQNSYLPSSFIKNGVTKAESSNNNSGTL